MRRPDPESPPAAGRTTARPAAPALGIELVWAGKYDAQGRRREPELPAPAPPIDPLERWGAAGGEGNLLLAGDNLLALAALLPAYRGRVQLIYLDPPFDTGTDHTMRVPVGAGNGHRQRLGQGKSGTGHVELVAYRDAWGSGEGSYLQMMYERLTLMRELLQPSGVLALHCDWRSHAALRLVLDEVFGAERFLNEIVWHYYNKYSAGTRCLPRAHDSILLYARGPRPALNELRLPRETPSRQLVRENVDGVLRNARDADGRLRYRLASDRKADDVWRIPQLQPASAEWSGYSTQKHHALLERIVALASREGDLVADLFCGAGTTLAVAERMGRRWIGCDLGALALHTTRKRLLRARSGSADEPSGFAVASLAGAARQRWLEREFGGDVGACRRHVLEAFGAEAPPARPGSPGGQGPALHGRLDDAPVALPELDGPCTAEHALAAARLAQALGARRLVLLASVYDARFWCGVTPWIKRHGMEVLPLLMPDALVTPAGNAPPVFRSLPRLEAQLDSVPEAPGRQALRLTAYRPGPARAAWSGTWLAAPEQGDDALAWLDGWSVDPAWRPGKPFQHGWWDVRTPHKRALADRSVPLPRNGGQPCVLATDVWGLATLHALAGGAPGRVRGRTPH